MHRIGRTGRFEKKGVATTFINRGVDVSVLMDLKHLLAEAKQEIPVILLGLESDSDKKLEMGEEKGCSYCGGLGHRIADCPKLEAQQAKQIQNINKKDYLAAGTSDW